MRYHTSHLVTPPYTTTMQGSPTVCLSWPSSTLCSSRGGGWAPSVYSTSSWISFVSPPYSSSIHLGGDRAGKAGSKAKVNYSCGLLLILPPRPQESFCCWKLSTYWSSFPLTPLFIHRAVVNKQGGWELGLATKDTLFLALRTSRHLRRAISLNKFKMLFPTQ